MLGVGVVDLFCFYLFSYNLLHYKDTIFINDQLILVLFPKLISGQLAPITVHTHLFFSP